MSGAKPVVSVIITAYNEALLVQRAIQSILAQTFPDWELIAIDDGSTDGTFASMQAAAQDDGRVRIMRLDHVGRRRALNHGVSLTRGEYVAICDADDYSLPERLELQVRFLETHPEIGVLGTAYIRRDRMRNEEYVRRYPESDAEIRRAMATHIPICQGTVMIRKTVFERIGLYETDDLEDFDLYLRAAPYFKFANLSTPLYVYELLPGHGVYHRKPQQWRRGLRLTALCMQAIGVLGLPRQLYLNALLRPIYSIVPPRMKTAIRRRVGRLEEEELPGSDP